jgi:hypothetical protein
MAAPTQDRFDRITDEPGRVGAHRGPKPRGRGWIAFAWAAVATGALVFGGLFVLSRTLDVDFGIPVFAQPTATPSPVETTADPIITDPTTIDPARAITIVVLNGTPVTGLQTTVGDDLLNAGWPVTSRANSSDRAIEETIVYYSNPADIDIARGLVAALGVGEIREVDPDQFPGAALTIVLGTNHPLVPQPEPVPTEETTEG